MSREIKFRAWDKQGSRMERFDLGHKDGLLYADGRFQVADGYDSEDNPTFDDENVPSRFELMQYIGLKDKHGVEIYEGDIVVEDTYPFFDEGVPSYRGVVEWIYSQWQIVLRCVNPDKQGISDGINSGMNDCGFDEGSVTPCEVLGNIYQNPELLPTD